MTSPLGGYLSLTGISACTNTADLIDPVSVDNGSGNSLDVSRGAVMLRNA